MELPTDRLEAWRRIETYRRRQTECVPRFDQSFNGACEQQNLETSVLQKRFLEGKAKRVPKKGGGSVGGLPQVDRKPDTATLNGNLHSSVHVQQKFKTGGDYDHQQQQQQQAKMTCGASGGGVGGGGEGLTKFSVEIVQQLEFTTSAADSGQPQQISTNVTVKALTNSSSAQQQQHQQNENEMKPSPRPHSPLECKRECKSEIIDDEFVGLEECAAALERDSAANCFPGLAELIGQDGSDDMMGSAAFADLITELHEYPELMKDFDFNGGGRNVETETKLELSPAAQTLKQMAEQHQYKSAAEWRYRPYRPRAPLEHLHASQHQQVHLGQPMHNVQVSAGQHMLVNGDSRHVSVAAQQGMYANFAHHHPLGGSNVCDGYSMSQSQSMNFNQQNMRARGPVPQPPNGPLAAAGLSREHHAKMMQQQQQLLLRHQQRPPPPDYRAPTNNMHRKYPNTFGLNVASLQQQQQLRAHHYVHHHGHRGMNQPVGPQQQQQMPPQMSHLTMQQSQMMNAHGQMANMHMAQTQSMSVQQTMNQQASHHHQQTHPQQQPNHCQQPTSHGQHQTNHGQQQTHHSQHQTSHGQHQASHSQQQQQQTMQSGFPSFPSGNEFNLDFLDNNDDLLTLDNSFLDIL